MAAMSGDAKNMDKDVNMIERYEVVSDDMDGLKKTTTMGTVTISDDSELILVPSPSADPRGTLHSCFLQVVSPLTLVF